MTKGRERPIIERGVKMSRNSLRKKVKQNTTKQARDILDALVYQVNKLPLHKRFFLACKIIAGRW